MNHNNDITETSMAIINAGNVDSGKSSLLGVLISNILDDGNGKARKLVAKHPHEIETGKTSDVSYRNYKLKSRNESITFVDLCGHSKYFKTTISGSTSSFADYSMLVISANNGIQIMTKQHLRLLTSLSIPIIIIITHIDITPQNVYERTKTNIELLLKKFAGSKCLPLFINNYDKDKTELEHTNMDPINLNTIKSNNVKNIVDAITNTVNGRQITYPIISLSNVTGHYIDVLKNVFEHLKPRQFWSQNDDIVYNNKVIKFFKTGLEKMVKSEEERIKIFPPFKPLLGTVIYICNTYIVEGIGLVVSGFVRGDGIKVSDEVLLGPFDKKMKKITIKSIHNDVRQSVLELKDHSRGCFAISKMDKTIKKSDIAKGIVMISDPSLEKYLCYRFTALITVFNKEEITLKNGYSPVIHLHNISQTARMIIETNNGVNDSDVIRADINSPISLVTFKFKFKPEFICPYDLFFCRSGKIHAIGVVLSILCISDDPDAKPDPINKARRRKFFNNKKKVILKQNAQK
jgi:GTPase